jgi:sugar diacid utilization regulator
MVQESIRGGQDPCVACVRGDYVIVGWSMAERTHELDVKSVLDRLVDQFDRTGTGWLAYFAVADPVEDLQAVPHVFDEARLALEIWRDGEARERVFRTGHLGAYRLIIGAATGGSAVQLSARTLGKVIEQDGRSGGKILPTFRSYLANNFSVTQTARALGVHVHTVQYRLHQLEALTGLRLRNAEERLTLELAVRIVDLSAAGSRDVEAPDRRHGPSRQPG